MRGRFLSLREEDFVLAARLVGSSEMRIILRHMVPSFLSHIIAILTLTIPGMILERDRPELLGLGCGRRRSVGACCCRRRRTCAPSPWRPGCSARPVTVVLTVLAFNFLGDGLRDAADPYARSDRAASSGRPARPLTEYD